MIYSIVRLFDSEAEILTLHKLFHSTILKNIPKLIANKNVSSVHVNKNVSLVHANERSH